MITLCQFTTGPVWGVNPSPFCMKVESYLRLAGIPYRLRAALPHKAPKGKLPFIIEEGGENDGRRIPDSGQILAHLEATRGAPLDGGLDSGQRALAHLVRRTCEESLFFVALYGRWIEPRGWAVLRSTLFAGLPPPLSWIIPPLIRRGLARDLRGQGTLRHSREEIYALGRADLDALAALLGDKPFFIAGRPTTADITAHAFLANILKPPFDTPLQAHARTLPALTAFTNRMDGLIAATPGPAE